MIPQFKIITNNGQDTETYVGYAPLAAAKRHPSAIGRIAFVPPSVWNVRVFRLDGVIETFTALAYDVEDVANYAHARVGDLDQELRVDITRITVDVV